MDIFDAFDWLSILAAKFTNFVFGDLVDFFTIENYGILNYWPFFVAFVVSITFAVFWGIVRLFNNL